MPRRAVLEAADYLDYLVVGELARAAAAAWDRLEMTVLSHGAGTQTSVLLALACCAWEIPPGPGHIDIDLALFADVGDDGTSCEWPETVAFLERLNWMSTVPILRVEPHLWNDWLHGDSRGLFDRYLARQTMPIRKFRSCTDWFKVQPQLAVMGYLHREAARLGIDLRIRQVVGYSADEAERAARFEPELPFIRPVFPLVEWGWTREETLAQYRRLLPQIAEVLGLPERSGCWFCPFQRRGALDPVTLEATPRSWLALALEHPELLRAAEEMEARQNERRKQEGKKPMYLYGRKPLRYWTAPGRNAVTMALPLELEAGEGRANGDDVCQSWGCFR